MEKDLHNTLQDSLQEWGELLKATGKYQGQKALGNLMHLRKTLERKINEQKERFRLLNEVEDGHVKKVSDRIFGALVNRDMKALTRALKDAVKK